MKKKFLLFGLFFVLLLIISISQFATKDLIWTYGFSYNISRGLIPYKDFNMIVGPFYSLLFAIPIKIFGNYIIVFKICNVIIYSLILLLLYKRVGKKAFLLLLPLLSLDQVASYNTFVTFLLLLILLLLDSNNKYKEIIIGLLIGIIILTKQNVGAALFIVYFFTSKNKIKSFIYTSIPIFIMLIYFIITKSLLSYIDLCYLGMGSFLDNFVIIPNSILFIVLSLVYIIKIYHDTKDVTVLYTLSFFIMCFPLINLYHFYYCLIPLGYCVIKYYKKTVYIIYIIILLLSIFYTLRSYTAKFELVLDNNFTIFNVFHDGTNKRIEKYYKIINSFEGEKYLFIDEAYMVKIYHNQTTGFYDLINKGNLGTQEKRLLDDVDKNCKNKKCTFFLEEHFFVKKRNVEWQPLNSFKEYVINNYEYVRTLYNGDRVFSNNYDNKE